MYLPDADASFPGRSAVSGAKFVGVAIGGLLLDGNIDGVPTGDPPEIGFAGISGSTGAPTGEASKGRGDGGDETGEFSLGEEIGTAAGAFEGATDGGVANVGDISGVNIGGEAVGDLDGDKERLGGETTGECAGDGE